MLPPRITCPTAYERGKQTRSVRCCDHGTTFMSPSSLCDTTKPKCTKRRKAVAIDCTHRMEAVVEANCMYNTAPRRPQGEEKKGGYIMKAPSKSPVVGHHSSTDPPLRPNVSPRVSPPSRTSSSVVGRRPLGAKKTGGQATERIA